MLKIFFIILYIIANELTYMVAIHQQMGLCRHISAGDLCWINRIIMAVLCIWYCGWIIGIALIAFSFFGILHATIGWILSIPTIFSQDENKLLQITEIEYRLLIPMNILCLAFTILSFFLSQFRSCLDLFGSSFRVIVISAILVVGFVARMLFVKTFS